MRGGLLKNSGSDPIAAIQDFKKKLAQELASVSQDSSVTFSSPDQLVCLIDDAAKLGAEGSTSLIRSNLIDQLNELSDVRHALSNDPLLNLQPPKDSSSSSH